MSKKNIYDSPKGPLAEHEPSKPRAKQIIKAVVYCLVAMLLYFGLAKIIPQFASTFQSFGAELPSLTLFFLSGGILFPLLVSLTVIIFGLYLVSINCDKPWVWTYTALKFNTILSVIVFFIAMYSMYLPIFQMGSVV